MNILWDLDGTIVDTVPSLVETFCLFARKYYEIEADKTIVDKLTRINSEDLFAYYGIEYSEKNVQLFREINRTLPVDKTPLFKDVTNILEYSSKNVLVTNRNRVSTLEILEHYKIKDYFEEIICVNDGFPKKPEIDSYLHMHNKHNIDLVIGDRELDLKPARELHIKTAVFQNEQVKADWHIHSYEEFLKVLKTINLS